MNLGRLVTSATQLALLVPKEPDIYLFIYLSIHLFIYVTRKTGITSATQLAKLVPKGPAHEKEPDIEWWDQVILDSQDYTDWKIRDGAITSLIEHPIQVMGKSESTFYVRCGVCASYLGELLKKNIAYSNKYT